MNVRKDPIEIVYKTSIQLKNFYNIRSYFVNIKRIVDINVIIRKE